MGFMSFVNASSEHNLVPWITEHMHPKDTRGTVLYNLHHVASWREGRDVAGKLRGRGILEVIQLHYKYLSHLTTLIFYPTSLVLKTGRNPPSLPTFLFQGCGCVWDCAKDSNIPSCDSISCIMT